MSSATVPTGFTAEQFYGWAEGIGKAMDEQSWSATERLLVWLECKRIVEKEAFARD